MPSDRESRSNLGREVERRFDELILDLSKAEEEEAALLYLMELHFHNSIDLEFFTESERKKIKELLSKLMDLSIEHRAALSETYGRLETERKNHERSAA